ncbi:HEPN domain-containing protein [Okeania hirsuta]|uniref:HEPN domain-containing protein n=1 Tax=Okeania hirsuta TaxID=1458930 RepID=A0A3N6RRN5_9CYAN|nr:HEPN domain-containing protein [Okeania hirsuta]RQH56538.1 HEPN domain-containing protein [Okeania hirsuta]
MPNTPDTYGRSIQLGASRRRLEDARVLHGQKRWNGAIYMGGYAIECALKSLICYEEKKHNFKDTKAYKKIKIQGSNLHNLAVFLDYVNSVQRAIALDRTNSYKDAWNTVSSLWHNDRLRYSDKSGQEQDSERFIKAVEKLHRLLLDKQG